MNPHEIDVLQRFADAMTACYTKGKDCDSCPVGSKTDCYFDDEDHVREALDILHRMLDEPWVYEIYAADSMAYRLCPITIDQIYRDKQYAYSDWV